jgi:type I restriction enzyme, S subunit
MSEVRNIPRLRFPEFGKEWNENHFKDVSKINQGLQIPISERFSEPKEGRYFYITNEFLKTESKKGYFIDNPKKSVRCTAEDVLMTRTGNTGQVVTGVEGAFHNNFFKIKTNPNNVDKRFLVYFLKLFKTESTIMKFAGTSTIPDLNHSDFYRIKFIYPSLLEQEKIADFLTAVDKRIELLEKKKTLLETYKKGVMKKIFNQEIRFKDDNGNDFPDWEEKRLEDVLNYEQPTKYLVDSTDYSDSYDLPVLTAGKSFILGYTNETTGVYSNLPTIIFDDFTTSFHYVDFEFKMKSSAMKMLTVKSNNYNLKLVFEIMKNLRFVLSEHKRYWISEYSQMFISIPSIEEQTKISNFSNQLDTQIELLETQIDKSKTWKKGLLQKMFV